MRFKTASGVVAADGRMPNATYTTCCMVASRVMRKAAICSVMGYEANWLGSVKSFHRFRHDRRREIETSPCSFSMPYGSSHLCGGIWPPPAPPRVLAADRRHISSCGSTWPNYVKKPNNISSSRLPAKAVLASLGQHESDSSEKT
ncbi:hypothetical protein OUZ56_010312 [Daphnia magna]|uniref:Uncharacterized protein n=1 Tax=Daphnia magna TaxID=35525 RepID=A0ABR0AIB5_9CRUS|nr:hypothetical protein OUZ56_010312 [Daphnia magna]